MAIWPVTGQGFQNTKWPAVLSFQYQIKKFTNQKNTTKPNYDMAIKKSEAILKCFIQFLKQFACNCLKLFVIFMFQGENLSRKS